jgi:hypothetical protein
MDADPSACEGCDGSGVRWPAEPGCHIPGLDESEWTIVERCDSCQRYEDDIQAAREIFEVTAWVSCLDDGWHAIGKVLRARPAIRSS